MSRDPGNDIDLAIVKGDRQRIIKFTREQRAKGLLICGVPGSGKTMLLQHMVRQDLKLWHTSNCGILLLDSQGAMFDDIVEYMAACRLDRVPVIPIDLRRDDIIVSYDMLRRRVGGDPAVHIRSRIDALLHAWQQSGTQDTPRLATWLEGILFALYERERPLVDALKIISDPSVRMELTRNVEHVVAQATWKTSRHLREDRFQELVESTANKLRKFLSTNLMMAMLSQKGESLDMLKAIQDGAVVLVSLATANSLIALEDAKTFGNLLLSEAWQAVQTRGATRGIKPFYIYVDECQQFVNPSMVESFDQARKFGLHGTYGLQFPSQFKRNADVGQIIFDSLIGNCRSTVVFQQNHPDDLEMLALRVARQAIDPDQIKDEIYSPKVFRQEIIYLPTYGNGTTNTVGGGKNFSIAEGENHSLTDSWSHTDTESLAVTDSIGIAEGESVARSTNQGRTTSKSLTRGSHEDFATGRSTSDGIASGFNSSRAITRTDGDSSNWSQGKAQTTGGSLQRGKNRSVSQSFGPPSDGSQDEVNDYLQGRLDPSERRTLNRDRGSKLTLSEGQNEGSGESNSNATSSMAGGGRTRSTGSMMSEGASLSHQHMKSLSDSRSTGNSFAAGTSDARTESISQAHAKSLSMTASQGLTQGISSADTVGGSETFGTSLVRTHGQNSSWAKAQSKSISFAPVVWQHLKWDVSSRTFRTVQEQVFLWEKYIDGQPDRHCLARLAGMPMPVPLVTATVKRVRTTEKCVQRWIAEKLSKLAFVLTGADSAKRIADQSRALTALVHEPNGDREAVTARRSLRPKSMGLAIIALSILCYGKWNLAADILPSAADPPWIIQSDVRPQPIVINGERCTPHQYNNSNWWMYGPVSLQARALSVAGDDSIAVNSIVEIQCAGRTWWLTKGQRSCSTSLITLSQSEQQPPNPQEVNPVLPPELIVGAIVLALVLIGAWAISNYQRMKEATAAEEKIKERERTAEHELERLHSEKREMARRADALQKQTDDFEQDRQQEEERLRRARESLANASSMLAGVPKDGGMKALAKALRERYFIDFGLGEWISVVRIINPDLNGQVEFRWKLPEMMPRSTRLVIKRGDQTLKTDVGLEGTAEDHIRPGRRVRYTFIVNCNGRPSGDPLVLEVKIPTLEEWSVQATSGDSSDYRQRYQETLDKRMFLTKAREAAIKDVEAQDMPDGQRDWMIGEIETITATFLEEMS